MNKTAIEWTQFTWNPVTGCLNHVNGMCKGGGFPCYAYKLANGRLKERYLANTDIGPVKDYFPRLAGNDPFYPRFWPERVEQPLYTWDYTSKPCKIFVCDMGELFGDWIPEEWISRVFETVNKSPQNTFQLLTKQPQNLIKWSPFPENCWVGVSVCNNQMLDIAVDKLEDIDAGCKFISFEPLLEQLTLSLDYAFYYSGISWAIIGQKTPISGKTTPKVEWVQEIVEAADKADIPVFLKENLRPLLENDPLNRLYWANVHDDERGHERADDELRQEFPKP